ncbi:MAG: glutamate synthase central domain-containing protein, partial [bacterium]
PTIAQFFVGIGPSTQSEDFERKLYVVRRVAERRIDADLGSDSGVAFPSLSSKSVVYKGLLLPDQVASFYHDLNDPRCKSAIALVHQRFSTNTSPSWPLAHPYRYIAHNGEINTIQGNRAWLYARQMNLRSAKFGEDLRKLFPVVNPSGSDSASLDQAVELLLHSGMSLPEALMVLVPEAWESHAEMPQSLRDFYAFYNCSMEPWDGPASICFSDGEVVGGILDRNGLRPARYTVTTDGWVVYASETGVARVEPSRVKHLGRLKPGEIFLVDTLRGCIVSSEDVKGAITSRLPYGQYLTDGLIEFDRIPSEGTQKVEGDLAAQHRTFGYTREDIEVVLRAMATNGEEASGSMGNDTPIALLSHRSTPLFDYFRQMFAQVTNPAVDPIREALVMSTSDSIGGEGSLLEPGPENACQIRIASPILSLDDCHKLLSLEKLGYGVRPLILDTTFAVSDAEGALERCLERLCREASHAISQGRNALILSDRAAGEERVPVPSLLAISAVQHHLVREGTRAKTSLVVETGEAREVHHFACLLGYGASAICPYVALQTVAQWGEDGAKKYIKAINKGLLKVSSKMGISTLRSYRGAQLFEAVGLSRQVIDRHFTGTPSRIGGLNLLGL